MLFKTACICGYAYPKMYAKPLSYADVCLQNCNPSAHAPSHYGSSWLCKVVPGEYLLTLSVSGFVLSGPLPLHSWYTKSYLNLVVPQEPALDTVFAIPLAMLALPSFDTGSDPRYRSKNALVKTGDSTKPAYKGEEALTSQASAPCDLVIAIKEDASGLSVQMSSHTAHSAVGTHLKIM